MVLKCRRVLADAPPKLSTPACVPAFSKIPNVHSNSTVQAGHEPAPCNFLQTIGLFAASQLCSAVGSRLAILSPTLMNACCMLVQHVMFILRRTLLCAMLVIFLVTRGIFRRCCRQPTSCRVLLTSRLVEGIARRTHYFLNFWHLLGKLNPRLLDAIWKVLWLSVSHSSRTHPNL